MQPRRGFRIFGAAGLVLVLLTGCAGSTQTRSTGQFIDDSAITTKVKTALFQDEVVDGFAVDVDTYKGRVQLSGYVDSPEEKVRAAEVARKTAGVQEVINNLVVK